MIIGFDEWRPDLSPLSPGVVDAYNVVWAGDGYRPLPVPVNRGPGGLVGLPQLLMTGTTPDGTVVPLAFMENQILRGTGSGWIDVGRPSPYNLSRQFGPWNAVQWGDRIYAVNGRDVINSYTIGSGNFLNVPGVPNSLGGGYIAIVGNFLVMANIVQQNGEIRHPYRLWWSGIGRPDHWTPDTAVQCDFTDRPDIGELKGLTGGQFGLFLGADGLGRMDYIGPPDIFQFRTLETDIGCEAPRSVIKAGDRAFWWSRRGWRMSAGGPSVGIGVDKVDRYFQSRMDPDRLNRMTAVALYREQVIVWAYVSRASLDGLPDEILAYDWQHERWTRGAYKVQVFGRSGSPSRLTDDEPGGDELTDLSDLMTDSSGDTQTYPAAIVNGSLHLLQVASGTVCTVTSAEFQPLRNRISRIIRARPLLHELGGTISLTLLSREQQPGVTLRSATYGMRENDGSWATDVQGRYHRARLTATSPFGKIQGVEIDESDIIDLGWR